MENPRATVYIAHGMGEHALRYERLASALNDASFQVVSNDHRGHGQTANTLGDFGLDGWNRILEDMQAIISSYSNPGPTILLGHGMGGLMAQQYVTRYSDVDALVLSGSPGFTPPALLRMGLLVPWEGGESVTTRSTEGKRLHDPTAFWRAQWRLRFKR